MTVLMTTELQPYISRGAGWIWRAQTCNHAAITTVCVGATCIHPLLLLPLPPPPQAFVRGRAASGLSCILVRVLTKATLPDSPAGLRQSTLLFLGAAAALLAACTAAASWLPKEAPGAFERSVHLRIVWCSVRGNAAHMCVYCMMHWLAS